MTFNLRGWKLDPSKEYLLVLGAVLVACVDPTAVTDRASIILTLLLASVAQKFVSAQNLPILDYQTLLDVWLGFADRIGVEGV